MTDPLPIEDADLDDKNTVVDGTVEDTPGEAMNEDEKPTLEEKLRSQNVSDLEKAGLLMVNEMLELNKASAEINSKKEAIRTRGEAMGINRHALMAAVKISNMNEDHLDGYDFSIMILRRAIGNPIQPDLFAVK